MRRITTLLTLALPALLLLAPQAQAQPSPSAEGDTDNPRRAHKGWRLVWADEFDGTEVDTTSWSRCEAGGADWMRHMSPLDSLCRVEDGTLRLYGIRTPQATGDRRPCLTAA